eukprot:CAMPEP_0168262424 /NCGR_PEP_ID=MMETSP0141_2-20121125/9703_1 /TAXON_ID=44445 /ORGANISM="Pseudo-nitzschia australis, Strain 10249 10 AB" /LENGTH=309 /DNA_ID=CAMNT_0008200835 /DNA_START=41 /DNA_END=970 /DNA_ORIENTATION=-
MRETVPFVLGLRKSLRSVLSVTIIGAVGATSDFNNHHDASQRSPYLYSEIQSVDFDIIYNDADGEHDSSVADGTRRNPLLDNTQQWETQTQDQRQTQDLYYGNTYEYTPPASFDFSVSDFDHEATTEHCEDSASSSASVVASSVLFDGDCNVSVEAMMCHGGGFLDHMMDSSRVMDYDGLFEYDDDMTDDDDDDDDNDGHSSMLSNASLRRSRTEKSRCYAGGAASGSSTKSNTKRHATTTYGNSNDKVVRLENSLRFQLERLRNHHRDTTRRQEQKQLRRSFLVQSRRIQPVVPFLPKTTHLCCGADE